MAKSSLIPTNLRCTSGDTDADEETKTIDDIAIGPSNEIAICGHIGVVPKAFINILDHDLGININNDNIKTIQIVHPNPSSKKLIYWKDKVTIALYVDESFHYYNVIDGKLLKSTKLNWTPTCLCFYKEKLFATSVSSMILIGENSEKENLKEIRLNDLEDDSPSDMVVVDKTVYICTKSKGRAIAFTFNGKFVKEFKHKTDVNDRAESMCVHEKTRLVFVSWNATNLKIYIGSSGRLIISLDVTDVYKLRITEMIILVTINARKDGVSSFDVRPDVTSKPSYQLLDAPEGKQDPPKPSEDRTRNKIKVPLVTKFFRSKSSEESGSHVETSKHDQDLFNSKFNELKDENKKMKQERKRLNEKLTEESRNLLEKEGRISELNSKLIELEDENETIKRERKELNKQVAEESRNLREKERRISEINSSITRLEDKVSHSNVERANLNLLFANMTEDVRKIEESMNTKTMKIRDLQQKEKIVDEKTSQLKDILTSNDLREISVIDEPNKTTEIQDLQEKENIVDEKTSQLKDVLTSNVCPEMSVTDELKTNRIFIASLQLRISSLETEKLNLQDQIRAAKKEEEKYKLSLLETKKELEKVKQNKEKLNEKQELLQETIKRKRKMTMDLKFKLSNATNLIENLHRLTDTQKNRTLEVDEIQTVDLKEVHRMDHLKEKILQHETLLKEHGDSLRKEEEYLTELIGANQKSLQTLQQSIRTIGNTYQQRERFIPGPSRSTQHKAAQIIGHKGGVLELVKGNIRIEIPRGALKEPTKIEMRIIPSPPVDWEGCFSSHSTAIVELLPNNLKLLCSAQLTLPHCLLLKSSYPADSVQVYMSHHKEGDTPVWEHMDHATYQLAPKHCSIDLQSFCWVKYEIDSTIVEGKRLNIYTAAAKMTINDDTTQVEVGYYPDLPGYGRILRDNDNIFLRQLKPYVFMKENEKPLEIHFHRIVPRSWMYIEPEDNPKIIPFRSVEISEERSCQFTFVGKEDSGVNIPMCMFNVGQYNNTIELSIRPEVLEE